ncbi:multidrug resistance-associated protein 1-like [Oppia nitens]|uniref:multidrug resistance-associated protein 1-like n=1 Tax=Oppia nitens TaxID=1686743 RepID=UPI0023D9F703|nr:multidrug resistance-associated protein 1-like [Oppia nitens]
MLQNYEFILYCINFALTVCLLIYCTFADQLPPENSNNYTDTDPDLWTKHSVYPKSGASYASHITYQWLNRLLLKGWLNKSLVIDDLWALRREDSTLYNYKRFLKQWLPLSSSSAKHVDCPNDCPPNQYNYGLRSGISPRQRTSSRVCRTQQFAGKQIVNFLFTGQ